MNGNGRYSRQVMLPEIGEKGQQRLKKSKVLVVGMGGLGCISSLYLAASGVGKLGIVDYDIVEEHNLNRQILYATEDVGQLKVDVAEKKLKALNPLSEITKHKNGLTEDNANKIIGAYDIVVDGTDNFRAKYVLNDICVSLGKPDVYGSVLGFQGRASMFSAGGPCLRCLLPKAAEEEQTCEEAGVIGVTTGAIGAIQAMEAIKLILRKGETLKGRLLLFDGLKMEFSELTLKKDPHCPVCSAITRRMSSPAKIS